MPIAFTKEQRAMQASIRDWATRSRPLALVRRLEPGGPLPGAAGGADCAPGSRKSWDGLAALGVFSIALPAKAGGAGGTVTDLAAALEQLTCAMVPGPVMPTLLAGLVLRGHADEPAAQALLPALADGRSSVAVGLSAAPVTGTWQADGTLRVSGETGLVLGGGTTSHLLLGAVTDPGAVTDQGAAADQEAATNQGAATDQGEVWFLAAPGDPGVTVAGRTPSTFPGRWPPSASLT